VNDVVLVGLLTGIFGVAIAAVPAVIAIRKQPSRRTTDAISLVDASGQVIGNLTDEIRRLDIEVDEERKANDGLRREIRAARDEAEAARAEAGHARKQVERHLTRIEHLEGIIEAAGLTINGDTPQPPNKGT
jgi:FtsZ-binding cell division protein ZapB